MSRLQTMRDIEVTNQKVLLRCDFNVPMQEGKITDESRIDAALPTINYLLTQGASLIICSHLGKPTNRESIFSLALVAQALEKKLHTPVIFANDPEVISEPTIEMIDMLQPGEVILLENTRFRPEETANGEAFSQALAALASIYINDAFGSIHRAHASTAGVAKWAKITAIGLLVEKEISYLSHAMDTPKRPFLAILGGSKVSDKIKVIDSLLDKVDILLIGGGMAFTFLKAQGTEIGLSLVEEDYISFATEMIEKAATSKVHLLFPTDFIITREISDRAPFHVGQRNEISPTEMGVDIGPETIDSFTSLIKDAKTVFWNGPMGVFEIENFSQGTRAVAASMAKNNGITIIGGGDSAAAIYQMGFSDAMSHISTGGGASLALIEGKKLPGLIYIQRI